MKIIGIDIAIENLAFCGLDTDAVDKIKKEEWFVLDTTPEDFKQTCEYENRKVCGKKAGWFFVTKETSVHHFYCATHKKCAPPEVTKWQTLNKNYLKSNDVIQSMYDKMDAHLAFWQSADYILIEKQPPKNPKMVAVMNYVYSYFVLRLWTNNNTTTGGGGGGGGQQQPRKLKDILFIDAKNKMTYCLSVLSATELERLQLIKNKYQYFKKCSISCTQQELLAADDTALLAYFNSYKKIDDLADSRNMVLWWLNNFLGKAIPKTKTKRIKADAAVLKDKAAFKPLE